MGVLIVILTLVLIGLVVFVVGAPVRRARAAAAGPEAAGEDRALAGAGGRERLGAERERLEAAREAKYREIRDAELDFRTGKLSRADYEAIDTDLRAEAIEILDRLERLS